MSVYVVGVDGSETAAVAAERAAELARSTGAALHVVSAYGGKIAYRVDVSWGTETVAELTGAEQTAEQVASRFRAMGLTATAGIGEGRPADVLVEAATTMGATLIVIGNKRVQGIGRVLGSVAADVAQHAPCDVLIVKTT